MTILIEGLTKEQCKAIAQWEKNQASKFFCGISIAWVIHDFKIANILRDTDPAKANSNEKALFALCGYDPSNTS